jgi:hypothetical protein
MMRKMMQAGLGDVILICVLVQQQQPSEEQGVDVCVGKTAGNIGCGLE